MQISNLSKPTEWMTKFNQIRQIFGDSLNNCTLLCIRDILFLHYLSAIYSYMSLQHLITSSGAGWIFFANEYGVLSQKNRTKQNRLINMLVMSLRWTKSEEGGRTILTWYKKMVKYEKKYMIRLYKMYAIKLYMYNFVLCRNST